MFWIQHSALFTVESTGRTSSPSNSLPHSAGWLAGWLNKGNHEFYDGAELGRFLNQTWEGWGPIAGGNVPSNKSFPSSSKNAASATGTATAHRQSLPNLDGRSTATSPLGAFLSTGNFHAVAGAHKDDDDNNNGDEDDAEHNRLGAGNGIRRSPHASNTSRYFSLDYGLIHFVALDLNVRSAAGVPGVADVDRVGVGVEAASVFCFSSALSLPSAVVVC